MQTNAKTESTDDHVLDQKIAFLREIDALKSVVRASPLIDKSRRENSAEHSWHLAMYALILADQADEPVDAGRVIRMLLIHDIVEIDAGDTPIHAGHAPDDQAHREQAAAERIYALLPGAQGDELKALWREFEEGRSNDARFAKSLDRLQPLIQNVATGGGTWIDHAVTEAQVFERYGPQISHGSRSLWDYAKGLVTKHFAGRRSSTANDL